MMRVAGLSDMPRMIELAALKRAEYELETAKLCWYGPIGLPVNIAQIFDAARPIRYNAVSTRRSRVLRACCNKAGGTGQECYV